MSTAKRNNRREYWLIWAASWLLRLLTATLRFEIATPELLRAARATQPLIFVFWHNRILLVPHVWHAFLGVGRPLGKALTSTSGDGELIAQFLLRFNVSPVRGSASKRGSASLRELLGWLKRGHDVALTPDGSRGPCYEMKPGVITLAQLAGLPIVPFSLEYSRAWRLKSWDRFLIPKPFAKVTFRCGPALVVPRTATPEEFEAERQRCQQALLDLVQQS